MGAQHSVSVAAAIVDDQGRVLVMQRRDNGHWEAPGGVLELGESIIDGLKREVSEETGLVIEPIRLTGVYKNMNRGVVALMFRARIEHGRPEPTCEAARIEWWTPEAVMAGIDRAYSIRVLDALRDDGPAVRTHDGTNLISDPQLPLPQVP
jgi:ADP-ribose pyrophosphatase YjhB (NUDIX family)